MYMYCQPLRRLNKFTIFISSHMFAVKRRHKYCNYLTPTSSDGYWLATSGGRLRPAHAGTHCAELHIRPLKETPLKKIDHIFCLGRKRKAILPIYPDANILAFPREKNCNQSANKSA